MFVAQCLEHDIAVQAKDMDTLRTRFEATLMCEISDGNLDSIPPAPEEFFDIWDAAEKMEGDFDNAEMRLAA